MYFICSKIKHDTPSVRLIDTEDNSFQDIAIDELVQSINDGVIALGNAVTEGQELRMINGSLNGYGIIELNGEGPEDDECVLEKLVVLEEFVDKAGNRVGYSISNALGVMNEYGLEDLMGLARSYVFANGEYVNQSGKMFMSPSERPYPQVTVDLGEGADTADAGAPIEPVEAASAPQSTPVIPESDGDKVKMIIMNKGKERSTRVDVADLERAFKQIGYRDVVVTVENGIYKVSRGVPDTIITEPTDILVEIDLPDNVEIGQNVFAMSQRLRRVSTSSTIIGKAAFMNCPQLQRVECPVVEVIDDLAFFNCSSLFDFIFPNTLTTIGVLSFDNCGLKEAILPASVKSVGSQAFSNNHALTVANMPTDVMRLWVTQFAAWTKALEASKAGKAGGVTPDTAQSAGVFTNCENLQKINLAKKDIAQLGEFQFKGCTTLLGNV